MYTSISWVKFGREMTINKWKVYVYGMGDLKFYLLIVNMVTEPYTGQAQYNFNVMYMCMIIIKKPIYDYVRHE